MYLYVNVLTGKVKRFIDIKKYHWKDILTNSNCVDISKEELILLASVILAGALSDGGVDHTLNNLPANDFHNSLP